MRYPRQVEQFAVFRFWRVVWSVADGVSSVGRVVEGIIGLIE